MDFSPGSRRAHRRRPRVIKETRGSKGGKNKKGERCEKAEAKYTVYGKKVQEVAVLNCEKIEKGVGGRREVGGGD